MTRRPVCLSIAGTDSGGGAGVAADLATFAAHGVWGALAVTAITAQDTVGVHGAVPTEPAMVRAQIAAVVRDLGVSAAKTGMLGSVGVVRAVAAAVRDLRIEPLVVDPVLAATGGAPLLEPDAISVLLDQLVPLAALVTPNALEAGVLTGLKVDSREMAEQACEVLVDRGAAAVLLKGGHLDLGDGRAADCLVVGSGAAQWIDAPRLEVTTTHGTGCVLSAAIAARLARGEALFDAVTGAKTFVAAAMLAGVGLGAGPGALDPHAAGPA